MKQGTVINSEHKDSDFRRGSEGVDDGAPRRLGALRTSSFDLRSYDGHRLSPWGYNRISPKSQFSPPANQFEPSRSEPENEEEEEEEPAAAAEEEHNELQKIQKQHSEEQFGKPNHCDKHEEQKRKMKVNRIREETTPAEDREEKEELDEGEKSKRTIARETNEMNTKKHSNK
ncbi:hypothetical protein RUM44_007097 [Polyplax serrata]|uniref:Uncharacterized protein n=1 Tax=Polyplax serrata TaxID=468196 RepID=A0ABR1AZQ9_POLSC